MCVFRDLRKQVSLSFLLENFGRTQEHEKVLAHPFSYYVNVPKPAKIFFEFLGFFLNLRVSPGIGSSPGRSESDRKIN